MAEENALFVDPESEESIARALGEVFGMSADLSAKLRKQGLERAQSFSWDQASEQILRIYQSRN